MIQLENRNGGVDLLDQTLRPEVLVSVPGAYAIEAGCVVVPLDEPITFGPAALQELLRSVVCNQDTADNLRTTADRLGGRLERPDAYDLADVASFLQAIGAIPRPSPPERLDYLTDDERAQRRAQLGWTLAGTLLRHDTEGEQLVRQYLAQLS